MDLEDRKLLESVAELTEENNKILRRMQRARRWGVVYRVVYWLIIVGLSFGAYFAIQPYLEMLGGFPGSLKKNLEEVSQMSGLLKDLGQ